MIKVLKQPSFRIFLLLLIISIYFFFSGGFSKINSVEGGKRINRLLHFLLSVGFGTLFPLLLSWIRWRRKPPKKFPYVTVLLMAPLALLGFILGFLFSTWIGVSGEGDNPGSIVGLFFGGIALFPLYLLSQLKCYRLSRKNS